MSIAQPEVQPISPQGSVFQRIFPLQIDNVFRGHWIALWLFAALVLVRLAQGVATFIDPDLVIRSADGILIETFNQPAQQVLPPIFRVLGMLNILICLLCTVALVYYRAMLPLMYLVLIFLFAGQKTISIVYPIPRAPDAPGNLVVWALIVLTVIGFLLSLARRDSN